MGDQQSRKKEEAEGVTFDEDEGKGKQRTILSKVASTARAVVDADATDISKAVSSHSRARFQKRREAADRRKELKERAAAELAAAVGEGEREAVPADWWSGEAPKDHGYELEEDAREDEEEVTVGSANSRVSSDRKFKKAWVALSAYRALQTDMPSWARPGVQRPVKSEEGGDSKKKGANYTKEGGKEKTPSAPAATAAPAADNDPWADDDDDKGDKPGAPVAVKAKAKAPASARSKAADPWGDDSDDGVGVIPVTQARSKASLRPTPVALPKSVAKDDPWGDDSDDPCPDPAPLAVPPSRPAAKAAGAPAADPWGDDDDEPVSGGGNAAAKSKTKKKTKRQGSLTGEGGKKKAAENGSGAPRKGAKSPRPKASVNGNRKGAASSSPAHRSANGPSSANGGAAADDNDDDVMF